LFADFVLASSSLGRLNRQSSDRGGQKSKLMKTKKFQRQKENFICDRCGFAVSGDGYTNHCPNCLWSQHIDIYPGDRAAACHGMMMPIGVDFKKDEYIIAHKCVKCGFRKKNKAAKGDNFEVILSLSRERPEK
jgi:hypothetical protein